MSDDPGGGGGILGTDGYVSMLEGYAELTSLDNPWVAVAINLGLAATGVLAYAYVSGWPQWLGAAWAVLNFFGAFSAATEVGE